MQAVNFFFVNALLFASLIAVVGVPVLYVTQPSTEEGQKESRRKIYSIAAVWVVLVFVTDSFFFSLNLIPFRERLLIYCKK